MRMLVGACLLVAVSALHAQHAHYAGEQRRDIKALTPQEIDQYRSGAGMGYAKAAELNRFPGPMHTRSLMGSHKAEARAIGAKLIQSESALDALFR